MPLICLFKSDKLNQFYSFYSFDIQHTASRRFGFLICKVLRINPRIRAGELNEKQCDVIAQLINDPEEHGIPRRFLNKVRDYKEGKNLQMTSNV